jgi:hypothetical protein
LGAGRGDEAGVDAALTDIAARIGRIGPNGGGRRWVDRRLQAHERAMAAEPPGLPAAGLVDPI